MVTRDVVVSQPIYLSIVVPIYNEEENINALDSQLRKLISEQDFLSEIIYVDDGSRDHSPSILAQIADTHPENTTAVILRRNFGQTAAIAAGIDHMKGNILILMDGDLQNDPDDIPRMLTKLDEGFDVVSGWRKDRKDTLKRRLPSMFANSLISRVTGVHLHDYGCTLKAYRAEVIQGIKLYGEMHRFIPVLADAQGARITELVVNHRPRTAGKSKYGIWRTFKVILDLITVKFLNTYGTRPMYVFGGFGLLLLLASFITISLALLFKLIDGVSLILTPLPLLAGLLGVAAIQSILLGLTTELLMRTYHESQSKPPYNIYKIIGKYQAEYV